MAAPFQIKLVAIGDNASKKLDMLYTFVYGKYPEGSYTPSHLDDYTKEVTHQGASCVVGVFDTVNMSTNTDETPEMCKRLRSLMYPQTDIFLVCVSVVSPPPMDVVKEVWIAELLSYCARTPFLLVGTEIDLRQDTTTHTEDGVTVKEAPAGVITPEKGRQLAKILGAAGYVECSARTQEGLQNVFETAVNVAYENMNRVHLPHDARCCGCLCTIV